MNQCEVEYCLTAAVSQLPCTCQSDYARVITNLCVAAYGVLLQLILRILSHSKSYSPAIENGLKEQNQNSYTTDHLSR